MGKANCPFCNSGNTFNIAYGYLGEKKTKKNYINQEDIGLNESYRKGFLKYDFERQGLTTLSEPSLKEYKIHSLKHDLNKKLSYLSLDHPEEKEETYQRKIEELLANLISGVYDKLLLEKEFWFASSIEAETLLEWNEIRKNISQRNKISLPNYIVFSVY